MPREKPIELKIEDFYKSKTIDIMLYTWMEAFTRFFPGEVQEKGIDSFMDNFELEEDDFPLSSSRCYYNTMIKRYLQLNRNKNAKN